MVFQFKHFKIEQSINPHKIGTDSMLLGAWTKGNFKSILDIGTGTGILALMQAQKCLDAKIVGIEPNIKACQEAQTNYKNSPFSTRMSTICSRLQTYNSKILFDLIICNPPFFDNAFLSENLEKNKARHTIDLTIEDLYTNVNRLLNPNGQFNIVFPSNLLNKHLKAAKQQYLYPQKKLIITNENGEAIRHLISYATLKTDCISHQMIAKYNSGLYSKAYVDLTIDFHNRILPFAK